MKRNMEAFAHTTYGKIKGIQTDYLQKFLGIPYASPPVGELRLQAPCPLLPWNGVKEAFSFSADPIQFYSPRAFSRGLPYDEDCLYLNIWTPAADREKRPVMVWIYGGGFVTGAGSWTIYDGEALARRGDVVVVTFNYRLGLLGLLTYPELAVSRAAPFGNWALLDQIRALEWIQENISSFGGNPDQVTVFGQSSGGIAIGSLLCNPNTKGLFQQAIIMGAGISHYPNLKETKNANQCLFQEMKRITPPSLEEWHSMTTSTIRSLQILWLEKLKDFRIAAQPCIDGIVHTADPIERITSFGNPDIRLVIGTTRDEYKYFGMSDPDHETLCDDQLIQRLQTLPYGEKGNVKRARSMIELYRQLQETDNLPSTPWEIWCRIATDYMFRLPSLAFARKFAERCGETYHFQFNYKSPVFEGRLGAFHLLDVPFALGTIQAEPRVIEMVGTGNDVLLSNTIMDAWIAFARTGSPSTPELGKWPSLTDSQFPTMNFDRECILKREFRNELEFYFSPTLNYIEG